MTLIFSDFGMFNHNRTVIGVQPVLGATVITPHLLVMKNAAARAHNMPFGSVWSIYDLFTGRQAVRDVALKVADLQISDDYARETPETFTSADGRKILVTLRDKAFVGEVQYFDVAGKLTQKDIYDDGGFLMSRETPIAPDVVRAELLDAGGQPIFELTRRGRWGQISKVKYVPENLSFDSENKALRWAFEQLVAKKSTDERFLVASTQMREALRESWYEPKGVALLLTERFSKSLDILFDHYEAVVFNNQADLKQAQLDYGERTQAKLAWNNFIASDHIQRTFTADHRQIYLTLGAASEALNYEKIADKIKEIFDYQPDLRMIIQVDGRKSRDNLVPHIKWRGAEQLDKIEFYANPNTSFIKRKITESMLVINLTEHDLVAFDVAMAIAAHIPVLGLKDNAVMQTYISDDNGKLVSMDQLAMVAKEAVANLGFYSRLADDLARKQETLSSDKTAERWSEILE
ncbi:hypothetical protein [Pseudolactococcus insecticola]|uniref:Accessory Sec system glycosyltransferase Asp1 n=1 Tax=Pseudolactococcus insecticola TaxID=2709158 RepID=A0A6A0B904_9LACT|nr:hypothetical protein [Lactococcus insecticola]GFH40948.1 hypothetical protein Hs20B_13460 [Lactococcus insecticola]